MHALVAARRADVEALCRRHRVQRLDLFGSAARGDFDPSASDLDFVVDFGEMTPAELADAYFGLAADLAALFGRPVDLVTDRSIVNPYFRASVDAQRERLYAA